MSSLHHHPFWGAVRGELNQSCLVDESQKCAYYAYSPKEATNLAILTIFTQIADETLKNVVKTAKKNSYDKEGGFFRVNPTSNIKFFQEEIKSDLHQLNTKQMGKSGSSKKSLMSESEKTAQTFDIITKTGLNSAKFQVCIDKAAQIASNYFQQNGNPLFHYRIGGKEIDQWYKKTSMEMSNFAYSAVGSTVQEEVSFLKEELEYFGVLEENIKVDPAAMSCLSFAFLKGRVIQAKDYIFNECPDKALNNLFQYLNEWNYRSVKDPDEGDFVVYVGDHNIPQHIGVVNSEGHVLSKLGRANPFSHTHKLFDVFGTYGTTILFFRKSGKY